MFSLNIYDKSKTGVPIAGFGIWEYAETCLVKQTPFMKTKSFLFLTIFLLSAGSVFAQSSFALNPQIGTMGVLLSKDPRPGIEAKGRAGYILGMDARIGDRFFFQPGAFVTGSKTVYQLDDTIAVNEDEIARTSLKLKAMLGGKLVDSEHFNLRLAAGPTYDFLIGLNDPEDDNTVFEKENFNNGIFNLDAALGMDFYILSLEFGYSYGLTSVFQNENNFNPKARYHGLYATLGLVFSLGEPN